MHATRRGLLTAIAAVALLGAGCGDDETTTPGEDPAAAETTTSEETTTAPDASGSGGFEAAAADLESAGFELREETGDDLVQSAGLPKPITAEAGAVLTKSGVPGDLLAFEFASEADANAYAKANDDDIVTSEVVGAIVVTGTVDNADAVAEAVSAIGG